MINQLSSEDLSSQLINIIDAFDKHYAKIIHSASGNYMSFRIGEIFDSLFDSGLDFYDALGIVKKIEQYLSTSMQSRELSRIIMEELKDVNEEWAHEYKIKYYEGIRVSWHGTQEPEQLSAKTIKDIIRKELERINLEWPPFLGPMCMGVLNKCRQLAIDEISENIVMDIFYNELKLLFDGLSLEEYGDGIPSAVQKAVEQINNVIEKWGTEQQNNSNLLEIAEILAKSLMFRFGNILAPTLSENFVAMVRLLERAKDENYPLQKELISYETQRRIHGTTSALVATDQRKPIEYIIEHSQVLYRQLGALTKSSNEISIQDETFLKEIRNILEYLSGFATYLWPEDWLAAATLDDVRHMLMIQLYRCRCIDRLKLTRMLQVHPKHVLRALTPLKRQRYVVVHSLSDGELVLITKAGEVYCEQILGLKIRCPLPSM